MINILILKDLFSYNVYMRKGKAKCLCCFSLHQPLPHCWDKTPTPTTQGGEVYFNSQFSENSSSGQLSPRQKHHGRRALQKKAAQPMPARKQRTEEARREIHPTEAGGQSHAWMISSLLLTAPLAMKSSKDQSTDDFRPAVIKSPSKSATSEHMGFREDVLQEHGLKEDSGAPTLTFLAFTSWT